MTSIDSDQPEHSPSMTKVLVHPPLGSPEAVGAHAISEDSDQTARMRRLIWVFACRTSLIVGFVVRWLNLLQLEVSITQI